MSYQELGKLYYEDPDNYHEEYDRRIQSSDTVHLKFDIKGNPAFFTQTSEVSGLIFDILRIDKRINMLRAELPGVALEHFAQRCLVDEIILTNKIEGVNSTRREINSVLSALENQADEKKHERKRFTGLVVKYLKLQTKEDIPLETCEDIRKLYDETVLPEVVAEEPQNMPDGKIFRKDSASIDTVTGKEIHRGAYPESAIIYEMDRALAVLEDSRIDALFRITIFHYLLEYIHPFYDGNGRLGRLIVSYLLSKELDPLMAYRISYTITEHINVYYAAFKTCNDPHNLGDVTPFLLMMLNMIKVSAVQLEDALDKRKKKLNHYRTVIQKLPNAKQKRVPEAYYLLIQASLFSELGISTKALESNLGVGYTTVKKALDIIDGDNLLISKKDGKEKYYSLDLNKVDQIIADLI